MRNDGEADWRERSAGGLSGERSIRGANYCGPQSSAVPGTFEWRKSESAGAATNCRAVWLISRSENANRRHRPSSVCAGHSPRDLMDAMSEFDARDRNRRIGKRLEAFHGIVSQLDRSIRMRGERPPKERLRSGNAPIRSQHEVYAAPLLVHSSVQMVAFALDRAWSERPGVVELSPGLSSPNRTCTSQRIRLSIQVLLKAKATSAECTSPACLAFHRLSKVFTLLQSVNPPCKPLKLPPFAMWPAFPASDYYEGSVNLHSVGEHTPLASVQAFPSSHAGLNTRARLPIAVFILAFRKSSRTPRSSYALSVAPCRSAYISARICRPVHTCDRHRSASCP